MELDLTITSVNSLILKIKITESERVVYTHSKVIYINPPIKGQSDNMLILPEKYKELVANQFDIYLNNVRIVSTIMPDNTYQVDFIGKDLSGETLDISLNTEDPITLKTKELLKSHYLETYNKSL